MNFELKRVGEWMKDNGLTLNHGKCHYLIFHRKQRVLPVLDHDNFLNARKLNRQTCTEYLGVMLDNNLSWDNHVNYITKKISKFVIILYNVRTKLLKDNLKLVYNALIYTLLIYCNIVGVRAVKPIYVI